jgi:hypothetical protein
MSWDLRLVAYMQVLHVFLAKSSIFGCAPSSESCRLQLAHIRASLGQYGLVDGLNVVHVMEDSNLIKSL